jgi:hypothetical protein
MFQPRWGSAPGCAPTLGVTRGVAAKLFPDAFLREGRRMVFIAAGLFIALVAADLLHISVRKPSGTGRAKL